MTSYYTEDISILCPQIPTSVDNTTGLIRALENGTEEVSHLLTNSCNLILECRCCKAVFRHAKNFHHHKLNDCRAYHIAVTPTYEQVLALQKAVAAAYKKGRPSTSKQSFVDEELDFQTETLEDDVDFIDGYDGIEEFCGDSDSPEPGEVIDEHEEAEVSDDDMSDSIEEGEYIEDFPSDNDPAAPSSTRTLLKRIPFRVRIIIKLDESDAEALEMVDSSSDESEAISIPESPPPDGHLNFPIFNDQLLESPTDHEYFGKDETIPTLSLLLPVAQME
ncbi:hypothetical protein COOONC_11683 [Cooperia oncophora]